MKVIFHIYQFSLNKLQFAMIKTTKLRELENKNIARRCCVISGNLRHEVEKLKGNKKFKNKILEEKEKKE